MKTVLILDVENGSAGSALAQIAQYKQPKLFGEMRSHAPLGARVTGALLSANIKKAAANAIRHAGEVAARIRLHPKTTSLGTVSSISVFLAPPWGKPNLEGGRPDFMPDMSSYLRGELGAAFGDTPVSFYTSAGATAFGVRSLFAPEPCLVCNITGEVSEIMRMDNDGVRAHATFPTGQNALLRTLRAHGGLSEHEFGAKYPERVSVYSVGPLDSAFSVEFCGGPHVNSTGELGRSDLLNRSDLPNLVFKIIKEEAVAQGIRRIKAVLE